MCYDIRYLTRKKLQYARRFGESEVEINLLEKELQRLGERIGAYYHVSGFDHPDVPVILHDERGSIKLLNWGLIPEWVKDVKQAVELSNRTLNARGEDMFEKPSFKNAARYKRCLVLVDGFFEYHWKNNKSFPYHITLKDEEPMALGGLWETWKDHKSGLIRNTFAIVTTKANPMMAEIHNKPRGSIGPRMPLIISKEKENAWLRPISKESDIPGIHELVQPYSENELNAFTVPRLKGKSAVGNSPEAIKHIVYEDLESSQGELF